MPQCCLPVTATFLHIWSKPRLARPKVGPASGQPHPPSGRSYSRRRPLPLTTAPTHGHSRLQPLLAIPTPGCPRPWSSLPTPTVKLVQTDPNPVGRPSFQPSFPWLSPPQVVICKYQKRENKSERQGMVWKKKSKQRPHVLGILDTAPVQSAPLKARLPAPEPSTPPK